MGKLRHSEQITGKMGQLKVVKLTNSLNREIEELERDKRACYKDRESYLRKI